MPARRWVYCNRRASVGDGDSGRGTRGSRSDRGASRPIGVEGKEDIGFHTHGAGGVGDGGVAGDDAVHAPH